MARPGIELFSLLCGCLTGIGTGEDVSGRRAWRPVIAGKDDHIQHLDAIVVIVEILQLEAYNVIPAFIQPVLVVGAGHSGHCERTDKA